MSMTCLALVAITSLSVASLQTPQDASGAQESKAVLSASEQKSLRTKLQEMLATDEAYINAEGSKARAKASKKRLEAKDKFRKEWETLESKAQENKLSLLGSMTDLRAIFDNCFDVGKPKKGPGTVRADKVEYAGETYEYDYFLPGGYKPDTPVPTVLLFPGEAGGGKWVEGRRWFTQTWEKTGAAGTTAFHIPTLPENVEFDPTPDFSRDGQERMEQQRIDSVWAAFGQTIREVNVLRPKVFVDCAKGTCGFGIRFVSMFPDRFAGIVLRAPTAVEDLRFGSLLGMPVLMIKTADTAQVVETLKKQLEAITPDSVTVIEASDEYPHKGSADAITEWMNAHQREMMRKKVVIEPNHNSFKNAYWVQLHTMNPIHTSSAENKPRIEVTADRETNRIEVKAQGIEEFSLLLNDELVDLGKEFTVVVNDKAVTEQKTRDRKGLIERLKQRRDWDCLFPVVYTTHVPK